jgi:cyclic beta-1,2-glucan synthetase
MLRIALVESIGNLAARSLTELRERELAAFWANRLMTVSRRDHHQLFAIMAELTQANPSPSPYFASQLIDHLYDEEAALAPVQGWLERSYRKPLAEVNLREQNRQTQDQISISNAFTSLRQLALIDWRQIFEDLSRVDALLRSDPAGLYSQMDFETRDQYRRTIEGVARGSGRSEGEVARLAVQLASKPADEKVSEQRALHVGTYLVGEARLDLARALGYRETMRYRTLHWIHTHPSAVYFSAACLLSAALLGLFLRIGLPGPTPWNGLLVVLLSLIPISQLCLKLVDYVATRILPPRTLPKMDFEKSGIPDPFRTLVVVPEMLVDPEQIRAEVEKLEIRFLANKDANLLFGLFLDYTDADQPQLAEDAALLRIAREGIETLTQRYPGGRFYLFHRERAWSESEQKYIGWERKRGKLEELNRLIDGTRPPAAGPLVQVGAVEALSDVRFVITLDSDTQLPSGTARRMVETLAHPLNQPRFDARGRVRAGSYTIIQPRVSPSLPSASATSSLFAHAVGMDPYTKAVSMSTRICSAKVPTTAKGSTMCAPSAAFSPADSPKAGC